MFHRLNEKLPSLPIKNFIAGLLGGCVVFLMLSLSTAPTSQIATVDVTHIINDFIHTKRQLKISNQALENEVKIFSKKIQNTVEELTDKHHMTLLMKEAVVSGTQDLTSLIETELQNQ